MSTFSTLWFFSEQANHAFVRAYDKLDRAVMRWQSWDVFEALLSCGEVEELTMTIVNEFSADVSTSYI